MLEYRLTLRNYLYHWWPLAIHVAFLIGVPLYIRYKYGPAATEIALTVTVAWFLVGFVPFLLLQIYYTVLNYGAVLACDQSGSNISFSRRGGSTKFEVDDIASIHTVKTYANIKSSLLWFLWDTSCYSELRLRNGESFLVTSLLLPRIEWPFATVAETVRGTVYPWPRIPQAMGGV